jgi:beta-galactosidase
MHRTLDRVILFWISFVAATLVSGAQTVTNNVLGEIPTGYHLQAYDDCGVEGRQPHVLMKDSYFFTFSTSDTDAGPKERSAVFSYKGLHAVYTNLDPKLSYVLALTYASDHVYKRVQSLEANGIILHGPYPLPKAKATRVIVRVPPEAIRDGQLSLSWKIHGEVNATVSIIELWANAPAKGALSFTALAGVGSTLDGEVIDLTYDGVSGAKVTLSARGKDKTLTTTSSSDGLFSFDRKTVESLGATDELMLTTEHAGLLGQTNFNRKTFFFQPVHYRPIPTKIAGLSNPTLLLNGLWWINTNTTHDAFPATLDKANWKPFHVPGQFLQQGFNVPQDKPVSIAREFFVPKQWDGKKIILRFDAVHGGTHYWLNGQSLGYSENLFTPVEWDVTDAVQTGKTNRLDLEIKVATVSEALSYSSAYAFHNLGGIDRAVQLFALPLVHIRKMQINAGLDANYRDGELKLSLGLENDGQPTRQLAVAIELRDPSGKVVKHTQPLTTIDSFHGDKAMHLTSVISKPLQWSAEKPNLYHCTIELRDDGKLLERIEREIGFRSVEVRERQLFVNGKKVKLAGACHHEFDPLTGRADTSIHAETDVRLLKEANLNLIRTSHYPPTAALLDAADRIGMYVECEAPFCWVGGALDTPTNLDATLIPTSAMIDYHHSHASILFWSIANESHFNLQFLRSSKLTKDLDPTRPTTFNFDFANNPLCAITDIANWHYPPPSLNVYHDDPRPVYFGEYFFPICHEQTDVRIDPGLRELWGQGQAEPDSAFAKDCLRDQEKPPIKPGLVPGGWTMIQHSDHLIGGSIWASHDEDFYLSQTNHVGYAFHHGYWGLIDSWRRPKPEWWLARHIFSPVWLTTRHVDFVRDQKSVRLPIENRFSFTDFDELNFTWQINDHKGTLRPKLAPGAQGELNIPVPRGTKPGDSLVLRVTTRDRRLIEECSVRLGAVTDHQLLAPSAGAPHVVEDGTKIIVQGDAFGLVFDKAKGELVPSDSRHTIDVVSFPKPHVTRYDFGDLNGPNSPPYAVFPASTNRRFESIELKREPGAIRLVVHDRYKNFRGSTSWVIDRSGHGTVSCDYVYTGAPMDTREAGIEISLKRSCDEIHWRRWSEWGVFPPESISRTEGTAKAHRESKLRLVRWNDKPKWPWSLDETELGTADFRSVKFNVYEASLRSAKGSGLAMHANADAHFRAALSGDYVAAHLLSRCRLGQVPLKRKDHLQASFFVDLVGAKNRN